jgi:YihY family inner membrane protein
MGVFLAAENAMARIWNTRRADAAGFASSRLRALGLVALLGGSLLITTIISGAATWSTRFGPGARIAVFGISLVANFFVFWLAFRLLTPRLIASRQLRNGAAAAAAGYQALQLIGSLYVAHVLKNASNVYGTFALVIGMLSWIYLTATVVLVAAEANVVAAGHLWPRSIVPQPRAVSAPPESPGARRPSPPSEVTERTRGGTESSRSTT